MTNHDLIGCEYEIIDFPGINNKDKQTIEHFFTISHKINFIIYVIKQFDNLNVGRNNALNDKNDILNYISLKISKNKSDYRKYRYESILYKRTNFFSIPSVFIYNGMNLDLLKDDYEKITNFIDEHISIKNDFLTVYTIKNNKIQEWKIKSKLTFAEFGLKIHKDFKKSKICRYCDVKDFLNGDKKFIKVKKNECLKSDIIIEFCL